MDRKLALMLEGKVVCYVVDDVAGTNIEVAMRRLGYSARIADVEVETVIRDRSTGEILEVA